MNVSSRTLVWFWCLLGVVVWCAVFDWWMHGATRDYLLRATMHELGRGPEPVMSELLAEARRGGIVRATAWAAIVTASGLATIRSMKR